jgi:hypothetical protein
MDLIEKKKGVDGVAEESTPRQPLYFIPSGKPMFKFVSIRCPLCGN